MDTQTAVERMHVKKVEAIAQMHQNVKQAWEEIKNDIELMLIEALKRDEPVQTDYLMMTVKMEVYRCSNEKRCGLRMCEFLERTFIFNNKQRNMTNELCEKFDIMEVVADDSALPETVVSVVW